MLLCGARELLRKLSSERLRSGGGSAMRSAQASLAAVWNSASMSFRLQLALSVSACVAAVFAALLTNARTIAYETEVTRAFETHALVWSMMRDLQDAEADQRDFLLTENVKFLEPFNLARERIPLAYAQLKELVSDEREQAALLSSIWSLIQDKLKVLAQTIDLTNDAKKSEALQIVRAGAGKFPMDQIRSEAEAFSDIEHRRFSEGQQKLRRLHPVRLAIMLSSLAVALLLGYRVLRSVQAIKELRIRARASDVLRESEERFRGVYENAGMGIATVAADGTI